MSQTLRFLQFDCSEDSAGLASFEAMASVGAAQWPALQAEVAAVLDWARPQVLPVTVVPATGHFFHGQLGLLKQLITGAWHRP